MSIDADEDIVEIIIKLAQAEGLNPDAAHYIEKKVRAEFGGLRVRIPKTKKRLKEEKRKQIFLDGLSDAPASEIANKHGITRRTLYRLMKRGS
jgi:DNA invertase Pin-like site-specific DNA recombinase